MNGATILITGATDGLGRHLAVRAAEAGARVVLHGRDAGRAEKTRAEILAAGGAEPEVVLADLADLHAVDRLAEQVEPRVERLDVLVNNAGVGFGRSGGGRETSRDGIELRFAVNYLAGYRLTRQLLPLLIRSAPARIVNVASAGQLAIDFADPMLERGYDGVSAYRRSKLAQIMFTFDLAEELRGTGVTVNALHPATFMATTMVHEAGTPSRSTVEEGGDATWRLITGTAAAEDSAEDSSAVPKTESGEPTGRYFHGQREARADEQAYVPEARRRLRQLSDDLVAAALLR